MKVALQDAYLHKKPATDESRVITDPIDLDLMMSLTANTLVDLTQVETQTKDFSLPNTATTKVTSEQAQFNALVAKLQPPPIISPTQVSR